ncbi:MAG TPA: tripartite tricarboxylate transporter substrate binding protein [Burkholderiales bacterium]|nr:tripartite tricarboxylate transporter substrate binding protein [Burkholderiales bacterium]
MPDANVDNACLTAALTFTLMACAGTAAAQPSAKPAIHFPLKPMRIMVSYTPGGTTDMVARTVGQKITDYTSQPVSIENRPSANGVIATQAIARSAPDGYSLLFSTSGHTSVAAALLGPKLPFDPFKELAPITLLVLSTQMIVAHPSLNVRTIPELVKLAKSRPGELSYGSVGVGSSNHLGMELLKYMGGFEMTHVPYKGGSQMSVDLTGGRVHAALNSMVSILPYIKAGKLVPLAIGAAKRSQAMPDLPTVAESGYPDYNVSTWYGLFAPAGTPREVIAKLNAEINKALIDPHVVKLFTTQGVEPQGGTPEDLARIMRDEYERWKKLIVATKLQAE